MRGQDPLGEARAEARTPTRTWVVSFSGGVSSWAAARRVRETADEVVLLAANTNTEEPQWRDALDVLAADVGAPLVVLENDGRDVWDVFRESRFMGNTRADVCSRVLKREPLRAWLEANCDPASTVVALGFDWTEGDRLDRSRPHWEPWRLEAPLSWDPVVDKTEALAEMQARGLPVSSLYDEGFPHSNCGGFCVKAGQAQFERLLRTHPDRYAYHEAEEEAFREWIGKDVSILRDRRKGQTRPMTLAVFRARLEAEPSLFDDSDWGACSCMEPTPVELAVATR